MQYEPSDAEAAIITIKWGNEFSAEHVNILKRAAKKNSSTPHRFYCFTDDQRGLDPEIKALPIPVRGLSGFPKSTGCWPKICLFHPDLKKELNRVLYIDIDTAIVGNIDCFFDNPTTALRMLSCGAAWKNLDRTKSPQPATGVYSCSIKHHTNIFEEFARDPDHAYSNFRNEQAFVGSVARELEYFPLEWILSFKYHLRRPHIFDLFLPPREPGVGTKMIAFHGYPRPHMVATSGMKWARFPRSGWHRPAWLIDYWREFSD